MTDIVEILEKRPKLHVYWRKSMGFLKNYDKGVIYIAVVFLFFGVAAHWIFLLLIIGIGWAL